MSEEIDVDALLDAPFKQAKVVTEQKSSTPDYAANAKLETANAVSPSSKPGSVEAPKPPAIDDKKEKEQITPRKRLLSSSPSLSPSHGGRYSRHDSHSYREREDRRRSGRDNNRYDDDDNDGNDTRYRRYSRSPAMRDYDRDDYYRDRSRSRHSRHRSSRRGSPRPRSTSPPPRDRSHMTSRSRSSSKRNRRRSPSPAVNESERDLRTVFAMQLSARLRRSDLVDFFSKAGRVRDAHIVSERGSRRSRGVAYVEFYTADSAVSAVSLSGERLLGVPIIVQPSEAQKNNQSAVKQYSAEGVPLSAGSVASSPLVDDNRLVCVKRLLVEMEVRDLQSFFDLFGPVEYCRMEPLSDTHNAQLEWMAFVRFERAADAHRAASRLHGLELLGARLRVRMARSSEIESEDRRVTEKQHQQQQQQQQQQHENAMLPPSSDTNETGSGTRTGTGTGTGTETGAKNIEENPTETMTAEQAPSADTVPAENTADNDNVAVKHVLLLQNMVSPEEEPEPNWMQEIEEDVKDECSKYGNISKVHVDRSTMRDVYVIFDGEQAVERARKSMDGRWFGGRKILATMELVERFEKLLQSPQI
ncbi:splicing factor [Coemansia sp. RSA 1843]|nr:splicing factor [Coemansia sp. RSA 1843]